MNLSDNLPVIEFNNPKGSLKICGRSIPENPDIIFEPLMKKVISYCEAPADLTEITIDLEYANTSSIKWIFHILERYERIYVDKFKVNVKFIYDDENIYETGRYLAVNLALPIDFIKK